MSALLAAPETSGKPLVEHFAKTCVACAGAVNWTLLCEDHAPLVRAYYDQGYLPWLRHTIEHLKTRIDDVESALELQDRIETGLEMIAKGKVDSAKGAAQIGKLEEAKAEDDRSLDTESLLNRLRDLENDLVYWQHQLSRATQKPPRL